MDILLAGTNRRTLKKLVLGNILSLLASYVSLTQLERENSLKVFFPIGLSYLHVFGDTY